jgi:glycosyltransferase involved in cell wall biosynthesis
LTVLPEGATAGGGRPQTIALVSVHGDPLMPLGAEEAGGQNVYVREVARALARRGHRVDVFTGGRDCDAPEYHALEGARVIRLPAGPRGFIPRNHLFAHLPAFARAVAAHARAEGRRYDVLHSNYWLSGWVGMRLTGAWGIPQLHTHHSLGAVKYAATGKAPACADDRLAVEDELSAHCATIVATSPQDVTSLARFYPRQATTAIVPCGVDDSLFGPLDAAACRAEWGLSDDGPVLLYAGRFDPAKGIETFVNAAARLAADHPVQLVFAGGYDPDAQDGAEFRRIQALVSALGLGDRARFLGMVPREKLASVYAAADVCVVPSHYESFGLVAIEAMACGTPVVASDVGGLRYTVVHRETGLLAPVRDDRAFAGSIRLLLDDPALAARMGREGTRLVRQLFTWSAVAERLEGLYASVAVRLGTRGVGKGA